MAKQLKYVLVVLAVIAAACGGAQEITLGNATEAQTPTSASEPDVDEAPEDTDPEETEVEEVEVEEEPAEPDDAPPETSAPVVVTTEEAAAAAEANLALLDGGETVFDYDVLDVQTGAISSIEQAVDGDRSVLLWFFAPH